MPSKTGTWGQGEFYEALCLLTTGACIWFVGANLAVFDLMRAFVMRHNLWDVCMLALLMGVALFVASCRKSLKLRGMMAERDAASARADLVARHDVLTGLPNRRLLLEAVATRLRAGDGRGAAILLVDLDRFKPVNDIYGHAAGDAVLCAVAERLENLLPPQGTAARLGGDEFALLVEMRNGAEGMMRLAQSVIAAVSAPVLWDGNALSVGATVGVALLGAEHGDANAVLHAADLAMYQGKKDGRGTFRVFKDAMDAELKARAQLEKELRRAIDNDEIEPFYQPVVSLPGRVLTGIEVLARWNHPERGLLVPAAFIGIAEETGLIGDLSYRLLRRACLDAKDWPAHLTVAVNIAPQQFQDQWLSERILAILTETGFAPARLEIEITETALVQDLAATRKTLTSLRALGVRIALDDFGTGYSSLYHLRELKFDKLKIDRSYVDAISMSEERAQLVDAIIKLGASLGLVTTAEGIETSDSLDWLEGQGCNYGQGYLFGAPMTKASMDDLVAHPAEQLSDWPSVAA